MASPPAAPAPRVATQPRRRAWLRIFVVRCGLPCDPPVGGHSCNGGMIPHFHRGGALARRREALAVARRRDPDVTLVEGRFQGRSRPVALRKNSDFTGAP